MLKQFPYKKQTKSRNVIPAKTIIFVLNLVPLLIAIVFITCNNCVVRWRRSRKGTKRETKEPGQRLANQLNDERDELTDRSRFANVELGRSIRV